MAMAQILEDLTDLSAREYVYLQNSPRQTLLTRRLGTATDVLAAR
jgi:hypothetical protein